jgi:hypothetical protein
MLLADDEHRYKPEVAEDNRRLFIEHQTLMTSNERVTEQSAIAGRYVDRCWTCCPELGWCRDRCSQGRLLCDGPRRRRTDPPAPDRSVALRAVLRVRARGTAVRPRAARRRWTRATNRY